MCLSVRIALTPPYAQVMQRQYHPCFRDRVLRVRIPPCVPFPPSRRGRLKTRRRPDTRGARPDRTGSLRLTGQDTALSRRQCGFDSRRDRISTRSGSPLWRRRSNVPEHSIRPRSASRAGDAAADIPVLEAGSCGFESRPAHHPPSPLCAGDATAVSSLFEEQGPAGSNPALRTIYALPLSGVRKVNNKRTAPGHA